MSQPKQRYLKGDKVSWYSDRYGKFFSGTFIVIDPDKQAYVESDDEASEILRVPVSLLTTKRKPKGKK